MTSPAPHSAQHFVPSRELWWNDDYLDLLRARWSLQKVRSALDVGCGQGHWTRKIAQVLPAECRIRGVERDERWVATASAALSADSRIEIVQGEAEKLPFADGSFELVTCQTVLIHVASPEIALREMLRVLSPGGRLLLVEPNNSMNVLSLGADLRTMPLEEMIDLVRLHEMCIRGKAALGEGWNSAGEELPGLLAKLGVQNIQTYVRDTATPLWPPYQERVQQPWVAEMQEEAARESWGWGHAETRRFFLAAGGTDEQFKQLWSNAVRHTVRTSDDLKAGRHVSAMGSVNYIVSGVRP